MKLRRRYVAVVAAVLVLCAGFALASSGPGVGWSFLTLLALIVATSGMLLAVVLSVRFDRMQGDIDRLARSLDGALRELAAANDRNALGIGTLSESIESQLGGMLERIETQTAERPVPLIPVDPEAGANVVALGPAPRKPASGGERLPAGWAARELELSLEPVVSLARSAAVAFEVHVDITLDDGSVRLVRRLSSAAESSEIAAFEHAIVTAAMHASRRQLGVGSTRLPLHVSVSGALLASEQAVGEVASLLEIHSGLASGIVLSIPADHFVARDTAIQQGISRLADAGALLAVEGWPSGDDAVARLAAKGVKNVKIPVDRLLDRLRLRRRGLSGADIAEHAEKAGVEIIATGVAHDEDAVALLDLGVDLMCGERFSPPRKLKPAATSDAMLVANG